MNTENTADFMKKAGTYGLQEFLEIMGELSQESTKKGLLSRQQKELITLGLALFKNCERCISIHSQEATKLDATESHFSLIKKVVFFMTASPNCDGNLWKDWVENWNDYSYSRINERRQLREMVAFAISIIMQNKKQIELHLTAALNVGISIEEIFEIVPLVLLMDGAPTLSQIPTILTSYEKYNNNVQP